MARGLDFEKIKERSGKLVSDVADKTKQNAIALLDQNDDRKLNIEDAVIVKDKAINTVSKSVVAVRETTIEKSKELEEKMLKPIFVDTLIDSDFSMPKFIRVKEIDKKHADSEVCKNSIGFFSNYKDLKMITIFSNKVNLFGITLFPDSESEFYYVDPSDRDKYIALNEYFSYLKVARINELQKIAQDLGAKYFKVTYKEEKTDFTTHKTEIKGTITGKGKSNANAEKKKEKSIDDNANVEIKQEKVIDSYANVEIAAEMKCDGHEPIKPALTYLKGDTSVQNLINMRCDELAPLQHHKFAIKLSSSSGLKEKDAAKIDAYFKKIKISGNATVSEEVKHEGRRVLEYEVEF